MEWYFFIRKMEDKETGLGKSDDGNNIYLKGATKVSKNVRIH